MDKISKLRKIQSDAIAIYNNIEWNFGGLIGMAVIILNPKLLHISNIPMRIEVDGLSVDGFQCLGIALPEKDRKGRANELFAMARRSLICEALEVGADFLVRAVRIASSGTDPYELDNYFSVNIRELWIPRDGRAGSIIDADDRAFFEKCVAPLRHFIRHNNGRLPPRKSIVYSGQPRSKRISISFQWQKDGENEIKVPLTVAHDIFVTIRAIVEDGLQRTISNTEQDAV